MTSVVEICNLALSNIRAGSINSLDENSLQAQVCKLKYPFMLDRCLTELPWTFNRKIRVLSVLTTEIFNWAYAYQYPSDCLKIHRLIGAQEEIANATVISRIVDSELLSLNDIRNQTPYEVFNFDNNKVIGANESNLRVDYVSKINDPNLFSADFSLALSHLLASELAVPIIGAELGRQLRSDSLQLYKQYLNTAMTNNMNEQHHVSGDSEFITIRR